MNDWILDALSYFHLSRSEGFTPPPSDRSALQAVDLYLLFSPLQSAHNTAITPLPANYIRTTQTLLCRPQNVYFEEGWAHTTSSMDCLHYSDHCWLASCDSVIASSKLILLPFPTTPLSSWPFNFYSVIVSPLPPLLVDPRHCLHISVYLTIRFINFDSRSWGLGLSFGDCARLWIQWFPVNLIHDDMKPITQSN